MIVINDEAVDAAIIAFRIHGGMLVDTRDREPFPADTFRTVLTSAIRAALSHLTDTGLPLVDHDDVARAAIRDGYLEATGAVAEAYRAGFRSGRFRAVETNDQAFARGVRIGREEAVSELEPITVEAGPSDYQVWRDALQLAAIRLGSDGSRDELVELTEWFWGQLTVVPVQA